MTLDAWHVGESGVTVTRNELARLLAQHRADGATVTEMADGAWRVQFPGEPPVYCTPAGTAGR